MAGFGFAPEQDKTGNEQWVPITEKARRVLAEHRLRMFDCPVHSTEMTKEIVLNIVVDRCRSCQGIWLDGGELDLLKKAIKAGMPDDIARVMLLPW